MFIKWAHPSNKSKELIWYDMIWTYIDQSKVVFINGKLLWTNVFLQSRGIGAL